MTKAKAQRPKKGFALFRLRHLWIAFLCSGAVAVRGAEVDDALRSAEDRLLGRLREMPFYLVAERSKNEVKPGAGGYGPWREHVVATVFWVGEKACPANPVANYASAWDPAWFRTYGGTDEPSDRVGSFPAAFLPHRNPFYVALPFNDQCGAPNRPPLETLIPWAKEGLPRPGAASLCQGTWVAVRNAARQVCYAQWEDVGPFATDHWQYVFGTERPRPNRNGGAGIDLSPAVRDRLGLGGLDVVDWRFVRKRDVPPGPWLDYGPDGTALDAPRVVRELRALAGAARMADRK